MRIKQFQSFSLILLAAVLCAGLTACADRSTQDAVADDEVVQDTPPDTSDEGGEAEAVGDGAYVESLPAVKQDTILLEGMPESITLELYETPESFGLPFITYHPEDIKPDLVSPDEGEVVRFVANMGGVLEEDAVVGIYVHPEGTTEQEAREMMQILASSYGESSEPANPRFPWSIVEYQVNDGEIVGTYALGQHAERYFHVMVTYPPEYGDGFGPRAHIVLEELRWKDTGQDLGVDG